MADSVVYTWSVTAMDCYPTEGGNSDVVFNVHWTCAGSFVNQFNGNVYSTCSLPVVEGASFVPYSDLTLDTVLGWIWSNGVDKDATEAAVAQQIENQINPPVVSPALPWSA